MKKVFLLLTAMLLSTGMWATESETFETSQHFFTHEGEEDHTVDIIRDNAIQSQKYGKIEVKSPGAGTEYGYLPDAYGNYTTVHWFTFIVASQVEVTQLDDHADIESITIRSLDHCETPFGDLYIYTNEDTYPFPEGEKSYVLNIPEEGRRICRIIVNYNVHHEYGERGEAYYTCQHEYSDGTKCGHIDEERKAEYDNQLPISYIDNMGANQSVDHAPVVRNASEQVTWTDGWYVVQEDVTLSKGAICHGDVKLILADGAKLTVKGENNEAGIRVSGVGNSLSIYGQTEQTGQLIATGGDRAAGIGGRAGAQGANISIYGGTITANGGAYFPSEGGGYATAIGSGAVAGGRGANIHVSNLLAVRGGNTANPTHLINHTMSADLGTSLDKIRYVKIEPLKTNVPYVDADGQTQYAPRAVELLSTANALTCTEGWYVATGDITLPKGAICQGNVNLILADGATLTVNAETDHAGMRVSGADNSLTIYAQEQHSGRLIVKGGENAAAIGGNAEEAGANIHIVGGNIRATAGANASAAIGSGNNGAAASNILVNENYLVMTALTLNPEDEITHTSAQDISSALFYKSFVSVEYNAYTRNVLYIDANGQTLYAPYVSTVDAASEQVTWTAGWYLVYGNITLSRGAICNGDVKLILADGAKLTATGGYDAAGIRVSGSGNSFTVYGQTEQTGQLIATGGSEAAAIGGTSSRDGSYITICGGVITATGGNHAAAIGGGVGQVGHHIYLYGGTITATSGTGAPTAIGRGTNAYSNSHDIYAGERCIVKAGYSANPTERITPTSYSIDGALDGKHYATIVPGTIVTTHYAENMDANYGTYYNGTHAYEVQTEGVTLYTASLATYGDETYLDLSEIEGNILPAGTPVIVRSETETDVLMIEHYGPTADIILPANSLSGTSESTTVAANTVYTLSAENIDGVNTLGFYIFAGTTIPAHKAYLQLEPGQSAPRRICFGTSSVGTATGIQNANANANANKYIRDGQLYIECEGRIYNVQGAIVK